MKTASTTLQNALKQGYVLSAQPQVIMEWNHNRYTPISVIANSVASTMPVLTQDAFPISSIAEPLRPESAGVVKAWTSPTATVRTSQPFSDPVSGPRYYTANPDSKYKYWISDTESNGSNVIADVSARVVYTTNAMTNKISILFERNISYPVNWVVEVTTDGTSFSTVATNLAVPSSGRVEIYRQAGGSWGTTVYRDNPTNIRGVRVTITSLNVPNERAAIVEISARLESDVTPYLISVSDEQTMSDVSMLAPIGVASSNTANMTLSNYDQRFTNENPSSLYFGVLEKNAKVILNYVYDLTNYGGSTETIRQFTMFVDDWNNTGEDTVDVVLKDASKFLQEIKPLPLYWESQTVGTVIGNLLDSVGFSSWSFDGYNNATSDVVPYFWADGDQTVWQVISSICEPTQTAAFFDEFGILRIRPRQAAYNTSAPVAWALSSVNVSADLANIESMERGSDYDANSARVKYVGTRVSDFNNGVPTMEIVWEPSDTVALRASGLGGTIGASGDTYFRIDATDSITWPYTGHVLIDAEIIEYDAKGYFYTNTLGNVVHEYISSLEEKNNIDNNLSSTTLGYTNKFSGNFRIKTRGAWGTEASIHSVTGYGYTKQKDQTTTSGVTTWDGGLSFDTSNSIARIRTNSTFTQGSRYVCKTNMGAGTDYKYFGTRVKFLEDGYTLGCAGFGFHLGTNNVGYYVEITRSSMPENIRATSNELRFMVRTGNGARTWYGPENGKGAVVAIVPGVWYDLEASFRIHANGDHIIGVYLNGDLQFTVTLPTNKQTPSNVMAIYTRGFTYADFEYLYGYRNTSPDEVQFDDSTLYDYIRKGFASTRWDRILSLGKDINPTTQKSTGLNYLRTGSVFFDDFGPIVHEIRQFDVKFEKYPNVHSNLYFTNSAQAACVDYLSTPFGAKFTMVNTARDNAILNGEDTLTFGADNAVDQKMMIYGRLVSQDEEQEVTVTNEQGRRIRGLVETEVVSPFIQSKEAALSIADWITTQWGEGNDELTVNIFGNPLLQLGDVVSVNYPDRNILAATHKYFVVSISTDFSEGMSTSLTLRRVKV